MRLTHNAWFFLFYFYSLIGVLKMFGLDTMVESTEQFYNFTALATGFAYGIIYLTETDN